MSAAFEDPSNDELAEQITTWAGRIAAGQARLLELIGEFDARAAWGCCRAPTGCRGGSGWA